MRLRHTDVLHAMMQAGTASGAAQVQRISQPAVTPLRQHAA